MTMLHRSHRSSVLLAGLATALCLHAVHAQNPVMGGTVEMLPFRITDAEFSAGLARIVAVSNAPDSRLWSYDPVTRSGSSVALAQPGICVSVALDGRSAVVGHDRAITHVDLTTMSVVRRITTSVNPVDVVLAPNGFAYLFPFSGQWTGIGCVELATGVETTSGGFSIYAGTKGRLHPSGTSMYGADNGLSPSDIERYDISQGTASVLWDSPYHGDYNMGGDLWFSEDGLRIFVRGANSFRSSPIRTEDMLFAGAFAEAGLIEWVEHASETDTILLVPRTPSFGGGRGNDTQLQVYNGSTLQHRVTLAFPRVVLPNGSFVSHGRFVFLEENGERAWAVVRADATSGALLDDGVVEVQVVPRSRALRGDVASISLATGGIQNLTLDAGAAHAGQTYLLLGSFAGAAPGLQLGTVRLPLNFEPLYFAHTLSSPNRWPLVDSLGTLDAAGQAEAAFDIRQHAIPPALAGLVIHHAFIVLDPIVGPAFASNAERVVLQQ